MEIKEIVEQLMTPGRGILATDATEKTMGKRMDEVSIKSTDESRRKFREILVTTPKIEEYISGVILNDEIIKQKITGNGFSEVMANKGILPGVKVDGGTKDYGRGEKLTQGIEGLRDRVTEYKGMGVRFTKWRAVITIGSELPTLECVNENIRLLAQYAAVVVSCGLVPIVEPEVIMDGKHKIADCERVTEMVHKLLFLELLRENVLFEHIILKTNMVVPGKESGQKVSDIEIAEKTVELLRRTVPVETGGIVFLSGGMQATDATNRLNEIAKLEPPWKTTFSFERALEGPAMEVWGGKEEQIEEAQKEFYKRARLNSLASQGKYSPGMEKEI